MLPHPKPEPSPAARDNGARSPSEGLWWRPREPNAHPGLRLPIHPPHHPSDPAALCLLPLHLRHLTLFHHRAKALHRHPLERAHFIHVDGAPSFPDGFLRYAKENGMYVLGICYDMQLIIQKLGGEVAVGEKQEYGKMEILVEYGLYGPEALWGTQMVWMSHGDEVVKLPEGFMVVARSL